MNLQKLQRIKADIKFGWLTWRIAERHNVEPAVVRKLQYEMRTRKRKENDRASAAKRLAAWKATLENLQ